MRVVHYVITEWFFEQATPILNTVKPIPPENHETYQFCPKP
jgi:hypothetical protein